MGLTKQQRQEREKIKQEQEKQELIEFNKDMPLKMLSLISDLTYLNIEFKVYKFRGRGVIDTGEPKELFQLVVYPNDKYTMFLLSEDVPYKYERIVMLVEACKSVKDEEERLKQAKNNALNKIAKLLTDEEKELVNQEIAKGYRF